MLTGDALVHSVSELNVLIKRVRNGDVELDELMELIVGFREVISNCAKATPTHGNLLVQLFSQLEISWQSEAFNVDCRTVQLTLLKRVFGSDQPCRNLVVWTGAIREIRFLSGASRDLAVNWILSGCPTADPSDWPVIFHNVLLMAQKHTQNKKPRQDLLHCVFARLYACLESCSSGATSLQDHFVFLMSQNGLLGCEWIRWIFSTRPLLINELVFSGLLVLSQDTKYFDLLAQALPARLQLMWEVSKEMEHKWQKESNAAKEEALNVMEYLKNVAKWIKSDSSEAGIVASLQLIEHLQIPSDVVKDSFFQEIYRNNPFARRELLRSVDYAVILCWDGLYGIDPITFKEHFSSCARGIEQIALKAPKLLRNLIESQDQLEEIRFPNFESKFQCLLALNSIVLPRALGRLTGTSHDLTDSSSTVLLSHVDLEKPFKDWSAGEFKALIAIMQDSGVCSDESVLPRLVELNEILLVDGASEAFGFKCDREILVQVAIEFHLNDSWGLCCPREQRLKKISLLTSTLPASSDTTTSCCLSLQTATRLLEQVSTSDSMWGTLKYVFDRFPPTGANKVFYASLQRIAPGCTTEMLLVLSRAICRMDAIDLNAGVLEVICAVSRRVVAESPLLAKPLISLLSKKYSKRPEDLRVNLSVFSDVSDLNQIRAIVDFCVRNEIEGSRVELIKSVLMHYGVIGGDSEGAESVGYCDASQFKHFHLLEKSVEFILQQILASLQVQLNWAHRLLPLRPHLPMSSEVFCKFWLEEPLVDFIQLTRGLCSGRSASKLHTLLASFYALMTRCVASTSETLPSKNLIGAIAGQLNRQIYALIPLQQDRIQDAYKRAQVLKKNISAQKTRNSSSGRQVSQLIYEMERFEEFLIEFLRSVKNDPGWPDKIVRSTARDFKIRLDQL